MYWIINNYQQVLLQLRIDNECWGLIGGSMEIGETLEQVAQRELLEETGLKAKNLTLINTYSGQDFYYQYPHGDEVYNNGQLIHDQAEATMLQFFSLDDLPKNISPPDRPILEDYIIIYKNPSNDKS